MRLFGRCATNDLWAVQIGALLALSLILIVFERQWYALLLLPAVAVGAILVVFLPQTILYIYIASLFWGKFILVKSYVGLTVTDLVVPILIVSYMGWFFRKPLELPTIKSEKWVWFTFVGLFVWSILSFCLNFHAYESKFVLVTGWYLSRFFQLLLLYLIFSDPRVSISLPRVINIFLVLAIIQFPLAFIQYAVNAGLPYELRRMAVIGTLSYHHAMLGTSLLIPIALCLARFLSAPTVGRRLLYIGAGLLMLFTIFLSGSRSPLTGIAVASVVFFLMKFRFRWIHLVYLCIAAVVVVVLVVYSPLQRVIALTFTSQINAGAFDISSMSRFLIWKGAVDHFLSAGVLTKVFGVGVGAYPTVNYDFVIWQSQRTISGAHNNFLHVLTETGIVGVLGFIVFFGVVFKALSKRMHSDSLSFAFFFLTIALLGSSMTQETFWFQKSLGTLWIMYMTLLALILRQPVVARPTSLAATV
jgi:O-antigen ligase